MGRVSPLLKEARSRIYSLESDLKSERRWRNEEKEKHQEELCAAKHQADREINRAQERHIEFLEGLVHDLVIPADKMEAIVKARENVTITQDYQPMMDFPHPGVKKNRPY